MALYHLNPVTGEYGPCHAKSPASCPFGNDDGLNHYKTVTEAKAASEVWSKAQAFMQKNSLSKNKESSTNVGEDTFTEEPGVVQERGRTPDSDFNGTKIIPGETKVYVMNKDLSQGISRRFFGPYLVMDMMDSENGGDSILKVKGATLAGRTKKVESGRVVVGDEAGMNVGVGDPVVWISNESVDGMEHGKVVGMDSNTVTIMGEDGKRHRKQITDKGFKVLRDTSRASKPANGPNLDIQYYPRVSPSTRNRILEIYNDKYSNNGRAKGANFVNMVLFSNEIEETKINGDFKASPDEMARMIDLIPDKKEFEYAKKYGHGDNVRNYFAGKYHTSYATGHPRIMGPRYEDYMTNVYVQDSSGNGYHYWNQCKDDKGNLYYYGKDGMTRNGDLTVEALKGVADGTVLRFNSHSDGVYLSGELDRFANDLNYDSVSYGSGIADGELREEADWRDDFGNVYVRKDHLPSWVMKAFKAHHLQVRNDDTWKTEMPW